MVHRRKEDFCPFFKLSGIVEMGDVAAEYLESPQIVVSGAENKLKFVCRLQQAYIAKIHLICHAAARAFYIHNFDNPVRYLVKKDTAIGFKQDSSFLLKKVLHQGIDIFLQERFPAGYLHQCCRVCIDIVDELGKRIQGGGLFVGVRCVTEAAPQVAACQADKDAGVAGIGRLPLDGVEKF